MRKLQPGWRVIAFSLIVITMISCGIFTPSLATPTPTSIQIPSSVQIIGGSGGENGGGGAGSGGGSGGAGGGGGGTAGSSNGASSTIAITPNAAPLPYIVKQIVSLGHETISGQVCDVTAAFIVNAVAPEVSWDFKFFPHGPNLGNWVYAYSIPRAGETHDAAGSYTLSQVNADGTLLLTMTGSDHVVFKGFDGTLPVSYKFNLVPSSNTTCPQN